MKNSLITLLIFGLIIISIPIIAQNSNEIDSLLKLVNTMPDDTNKVILLDQISNKFYNNDAEKQKIYAEKSLKLSEELKYHAGILNSYYSLSLYYKSTNEYEKGLEILNFVLSKPYITGNDSARFLIQIGSIYKDLGQYEKASIYYFNALNKYKIHKNDEEIAKLKINIGIVLFFLKKNEESLNSFNDALIYFEQTGNYKMQGICLTSIANVYYVEKKYKEAIDIYSKVDVLYSKSDANKRNYAHLYYNVASAYRDMNKDSKKFDEAIDFFEKALLLYKELDNKKYYASTLNGIAGLKIYQHKYNEAIKLSNECIKISKIIGIKLEIVHAYEIIGYSYIGLNNTDSAYYYLAKFKNLNDSLVTENNRGMITEMQTKYETEKKEQQIIVLTKEKELQNAESKNKTYLIIVLGLIIFTAGIVVYYYLKNQKNKHRQKIIEERAGEAENQKKRFAKELHDGTGSNLTGIRLQLLALKDKTGGNGEFSEIIKEIDRTHQAVRLLSYQAVPPEFDNYTLEQATHDLVRRLTKTGSVNINYSSTVQINWTHTTKEFQLEIYRIIQEALSNVIKHSAAKNVDIQLIQHENQFNLMIDDDGKGFDTETVNKGIGLNNIGQRTKNIGGTLHIDTATGKGTSLSIDFPLPKIMKHAV